MSEYNSTKLGWGIALFLGVVLILLSCVYVYRFGDYPIGSHSAFGEFGDFFGGILNPLIGMVTAFFLYHTFQEQKKFNEAQGEFNKSQEFFQRLTILINATQSFKKESLFFTKQDDCDNFLSCNYIDISLPEGRSILSLCSAITDQDSRKRLTAFLKEQPCWSLTYVMSEVLQLTEKELGIYKASLGELQIRLLALTAVSMELNSDQKETIIRAKLFEGLPDFLLKMAVQNYGLSTDTK